MSDSSLVINATIQNETHSFSEKRNDNQQYVSLEEQRHYPNGQAIHCVDEFLQRVGGKRPIKKVLIANNGLAAVKAIRSIREWAFETLNDEHAIEFVAMATPDDIAANAEYIRMADVWISVPGGPNNYNFANVELIVDRAERFACDAVWVGWGHASEYPALPERLKAVGIVFLGPSAEAMRALGDKVASTIIAQSAGVPTCHWSGDDLRIDYARQRSIPDSVYQKACISSLEDALSVADRVGFPCIFKASAGGGGKGIRIVRTPDAVEAAYRQVAFEVPGSPIFAMKLIENARHVEVQIVADDYGNAIALHGRDCSVQRRHQKVIEEGPISALPEKILAKLESAAVRLTKEVGYVGAGTVEYLYTGNREHGDFFFLELNPRLQVEHPVTEFITGVNIPALQLLIGMGVPLERCSDVQRLFNISQSDISTKSASDLRALLLRRPPTPTSHVIACRITSEDAYANFQPRCGSVDELTLRPCSDTWGYFSLNPPATLSQFSDSQFGHIFSRGPTREAARKSLVLTLRTLTIRGSITTPAHYLAQLLTHPVFVENEASTAWLDSLISNSQDRIDRLPAPIKAHYLSRRSAVATDFAGECSLSSGGGEAQQRTEAEVLNGPEDDALEVKKRSRSNSPESTTRRSGLTLSTSGNSIEAKSHVRVSSHVPPTAILLVTTAAAYASKKFSAVFGKFISALERGHVPVVDSSLTCAEVPVTYEDIEYPFRVTRADIGEYRVALGNATASREGIVVGVKALEDGTTAVLLGRRSYVVEVEEERDGGLRVTIDGVDVKFAGEEAEPSEVRAAVTGKIVRWLKGNGDIVAKDELVAELEVMKMVVEVHSKMEGNIRILLPENTMVEKGQILAVLSSSSSLLEESSSVPSGGRQGRRKAYNGGIWSLLERDLFDNLNPCRKPHQQFAQALLNVEKLLNGYDADPAAIRDLFDLIGNDEVAYGELIDSLSIASNRLSNGVYSKLQDLIKNSSGVPTTIINRIGKTETREKNSALTYVMSEVIRICSTSEGFEDVRKVAEQWKKGWDARAVKMIGSLIQSYVRTEKFFAVPSIAAGDVISGLRAAYRDQLDSLAVIAASHVAVSQKNKVLLSLLAEISQQQDLITGSVREGLHELTQLFHPTYNDVALRARMILADARRPRFSERKNQVKKILLSIQNGDVDCISAITDAKESTLDVLVTFALNVEEDPELRKTALRCQVLRAYGAYEVSGLSVQEESGILVARWNFRLRKSLESSQQRSYGPEKGTHQSPMVSFDSADNLVRGMNFGEKSGSKNLDGGCRRGMLTVFSSWVEMQRRFRNVLERYSPTNISSATEHNSSGGTDSKSVNHVHPKLSVNVLTVIVRWDGIIDSEDPAEGESAVSSALSTFCRSDRSTRALMESAGVRTVTFIVVPGSASDSSFPGLYTFRIGRDFEEDPIYRHIDPPMACELELARLSNFDIHRFGYPNREIHVFYAVGKTRKEERAHDNDRCSQSKVVWKPPRSSGSVGEDELRKPSLAKAESLQAKRRRALVESTHSQSRERDEIETGKPQPISAKRDVDARFFVRAVVRHAEVFKTTSDAAVAIPEAERTFSEALDAVEMAKCDRRFLRTDSNHIFLNVLASLPIDVEDVESICKRMYMRCSARCWNLRVFTVEIKVSAMLNHDTCKAPVPLRFLLFNPTGHMLRVESYIESSDGDVSDSARLISIPGNEPRGRMHGNPACVPYPIMDRVQRKRIVAQTIETTYVYDFVHLFSRELHKRWRRYSQARLLGGFRRHKPPQILVEATELVLSKDSASGLSETDRPPGENDIGMVAWRYKLYTPEYPNGREVIVIANDITFKAGSFGTAEDELFMAASRLARAEGIPRIYLAANSGARIGIAEEVLGSFKVNWNDENDPSKGFDGLFLTESDIAALKGSVNTKAVGDKLFIDGIIGAQHGLGIENLMGSGMIAGETSKAYDETFTITYVTSRTVGIGAYLVRLGQRVIQKDKAAPIILTGYSALNKVLGHNIYASNEQLGGTKIMHSNGIAHRTVADDVQGADAILEWLSYVPSRKGERLPVIESLDPITRKIEVCPPLNGVPYDPRVYLISGRHSEAGTLGGFFDQGSFRETLAGWAKTVVVGRARLGGIPTGVIAVETRTTERLIPADPASPETHENLFAQAGQVWYPDSAAKTAQAIRDLDREGLPLFIFANWRGFSGGMRDMFDEVLKFGSEIVDGLRSYHGPVFVYIPPGGEVRGGAWVVLDTLINPSAIEMYADSTARGGVLEPEGVVDVKYRRRTIVQTMHRLDPKLRKLDEELSSGDRSIVPDEEHRKIVQEQINIREAEILASYTSVAAAFCDLHDRPARMLQMGAIRKVVDWKHARTFFYWRLQRRIAESRIRNLCFAANPSLTGADVTALLRCWADRRISEQSAGEEKESASKDSLFDNDDRWTYQWLEDDEASIIERIRKIRCRRIADEVSDLAKEEMEGFLNGLEKTLLAVPDAAVRAKLTLSIQERIERASNESTKSAVRGLLSRFGFDRGFRL